MFDLAKSSLFFEQMDAEHPALVQNIEIVNENGIALDATYHYPKQFILSLNNVLRSLLFFMESSIKNSPKWLKNSVVNFRSTRLQDYEALKHLRNVSAHQKLIFRSYDRLIARGAVLPFRIRQPGENFFFEGDVSEVSTLIQVDDEFVLIYARVIGNSCYKQGASEFIRLSLGAL